jgi:hypothetical protein
MISPRQIRAAEGPEKMLAVRRQANVIEQVPTREGCGRAEGKKYKSAYDFRRCDPGRPVRPSRQ